MSDKPTPYLLGKNKAFLDKCQERAKRASQELDKLEKGVVKDYIIVRLYILDKIFTNKDFSSRTLHTVEAQLEEIEAILNINN